jgi:glycosyltransferase involved in cell wall biosynthesis
VYLTYRPGGIDLLAESLAQQPPSLYELVVVDDFPGRPLRGVAASYIRSKGIPLRWYGPSKPHSYPEKKKNGLACAMNTGAAYCTTGHVIFVSDFVWFPPGSVVQWINAINGYQHNTLISGIGSVRSSEPPHGHGDISIWHGAPYPYCVHHIHEESEEWIPRVFETFYYSHPMELLEKTNGIDEMCDCGHISWSMQVTELQGKSHGYHLTVDRRLRIYVINHRLWKEFDKELWHAEEMSAGEKDRIEHTFQSVAQHPFSFKELRERCLKENS